jgi:hypothetical protein
MKDRTRASAALFITKLGAAERQLNAAIRMMLADEDELAVHTVAAAGYRQLREIEEARGGRPAAGWYARLFIGAAQLAAAGSLLPAEFETAFGPTAVKVIENIASEIGQGLTPTVAEVSRRLDVPPEKVAWRSFNKTANFLKHADRDTDLALPNENLAYENMMLLGAAVALFSDLLNRSTPEMIGLLIFVKGAEEDFRFPGWSEEHFAIFSRASPARRRRICQRVIRSLRKEEIRARRAG